MSAPGRPGGGVVELRGPDAVSYAQGQLSADVAALGDGESTLSLLLEPTGKLSAVVRVRRRGEEALDLEVDADAVEAVVTRLRRFLVRTDATVEPGGPASDAVDGGSGEPAEVARIRAGWPLVGHEYGGPFSGEVIPAEVGRWLIDDAVSFTKGCYVGQELTARINSRGGNVPRHLRLIELPEGVQAEPGDDIVLSGDGGDDDTTAQGTVTSAAVDPLTGITVALGYVHRRVPEGASLTVRPAVP